MAITLIIVGSIIHAIGYFWLVVLAYREIPTAGRVALFAWPIGLLMIFVRQDRDVVKTFIIAVVGLAILWFGISRIPPEPPRPADAPFEFGK